MNLGFRDYVKAAFNARPWGMPIPPNWLMLAGWGILGFLNPGFWALGAGVEIAYLFLLTSNARFRRLVQSKALARARKESEARIERIVAGLETEDRERYQRVEEQCRSVVERQGGDVPQADVVAQGEGLGRLLWIYLRLISTRRSVLRSLEEALAELREGRSRSRGGEGEEGCLLIEAKVKALEARLSGEAGLPEEVRKSLTGQVEILQMRLKNRRETLEKLTFLDAELTRIEEQVKLIREQATLAADPGSVSRRIDQVSATLGGTSQWIREQQRIFGEVEDLLEEPAVVVAPLAAKEGR